MSTNKYPCILLRQIQAIFLYIFVQNRGYCVSYPSNILQHTQKMFKNSLLFAVDIFCFEFSLV